MSNTADGESILRDIFGKEVLILPYIMPGFVLAQQVFEQTRGLDWSSIKGIFLMHHGLFTFHDDARSSYENMIELVSGVEDYLDQKGILQQQAVATYSPDTEDMVLLATMRKQVSALAGRAMLARMNTT